ncbi:MAG: ribosomal RNA small subunit methyltransferase A [Candidatus Buchananbacteria bacterium RIFCSPHIGHO2_02_FULL_40_13]|uniref:Ribosomal RNA small subunit methyltransferase A n=1 Tax=Candidatus Buchananbacteria bacterium RIFCSPLOWO2_01_FULL_39_33 TaxID=1797543 RepID=A0A1G1YHV8_9BACT|nr:MAG: ribosomal RNA small subunit methyltransferase A [Candidatus Buchananbacteria bacterium RIFCSPHIGHO2_01_FULL_40_35]OGY48994.1 MAG: ribosomal RNA small subunit methyltransferase A [Candidatus Buchananbacteria bacterium RIFCSPHIGHO2_02_FULL_40_13]OGY51844.1 MAG: ribosomal RNA small subunit methyltransferase A [Candidatus Buchananbacteria bacterium RIFCSPLOWO2_01_FULL_39_33]
MLSLFDIRQICQEYSIVPQKSQGQNFLFDDNIVKKIITAANLNVQDTVLEIGPGLGVLTDYLINEAGQVIAVELDKKLLGFLEKRYQSVNNLKIIEGDILKLDINAFQLKPDYKIVANLPYNITSNFLRKFLAAPNPPSKMILMVQKEVAKRIVAKKGEMNLLAVAVQFYAEPQVLFEVSRQSFWPSPKVDSAVIKIKRKSQLFPVDQKLFFRLVKIGFSAKRKQLQNNLANGFHLEKNQAKDLIIKSGLAEKIRAQDLELKDWLRILEQL